MKIVMTADYYTQHMQVTREQKQACIGVVKELLTLAFVVKEQGFLKLDELLHTELRVQDRFLRRAAAIVIETSNQESIETVLYNLIFTSSEVNNNPLFFRSVVVAETMIALGKGEDMDYIFAHLVPSFFGEYADQVEETYYQVKREHMTRGLAAAAEKG